MLYCCTECTIVFPCCLGCKTFPKDSRNGKEESNLVFILIDEVESLAAARKAAISGSEPLDSIRVYQSLWSFLEENTPFLPRYSFFFFLFLNSV
ncbi:hypothetical protein Ahy_B09g096723 isoform B [Arachis hypogaea]|uniref:Pachytene checkpoint protein 2 homolog n=1 Tax=Arachis hypogaea TaxID=3818 RepID=A0A444XM61_ARAHY|nr:hypothetical protein Ahy_B09g096723 isoform B [Arachis hypogaea]